MDFAELQMSYFIPKKKKKKKVLGKMTFRALF